MILIINIINYNFSSLFTSTLSQRYSTISHNAEDTGRTSQTVILSHFLIFLFFSFSLCILYIGALHVLLPQ